MLHLSFQYYYIRSGQADVLTRTNLLPGNIPHFDCDSEEDSFLGTSRESSLPYEQEEYVPYIFEVNEDFTCGVDGNMNYLPTRKLNKLPKEKEKEKEKVKEKNKEKEKEEEKAKEKENERALSVLTEQKKGKEIVREIGMIREKEEEIMMERERKIKSSSVLPLGSSMLSLFLTLSNSALTMPEDPEDNEENIKNRNKIRKSPPSPSLWLDWVAASQ